MRTRISRPSPLRAHVALVTGGGTGIGRGIALGLARRGVDVALVGRRRGPLAETAAEVERLGVRAAVIVADISSASGRAAALDHTHSTLGPIDILVHNAAILAGGELNQLSEVEVAAAVATNLTAPLLLTRAALPDLVARRGVVVLVGSGASLVPLPALSIYSATKAGLRAFGEALRYELEPQGVRVLMVYPPATDTAMIAGMAHAAGMPYPLADPARIGERIVAALDTGQAELHFFGPERMLAIVYHLAPGLVGCGLAHERERFARMMAAPRHASSGDESPPRAYDATSRQLLAQLRSFRRSHPPAQTQLRGHQWSYLMGATADNAEGQASIETAPEPADQRGVMPTPATSTILLLPGAPGQAEHSFAYIEALECEYRVLCPSYPSSIQRLDDLADGAIALLRHEGVDRAHVVGGSYGSMVAQAIADRVPERVATLILEHPSAPHPARARLAPLLLALVRGIPMPLLRCLIALACRPYLGELTQGRALWRDCFRTTIAGLSRQDCVARLAVLLDYDRPYDRNRDGYGACVNPPARPTLIVEADHDRLVTRRERAWIRTRFPHAKVVTVPRATHVGALEAPGRYVALFRAFLAEAATAEIAP